MGLFRSKKVATRPGPHRVGKGTLSPPKSDRKNLSEPVTSNPPTRRRVHRDKRMTYCIRCWLLIEKNDWVVETTTVNLSKSGVLVRALNPLPIGQPVLMLLIDNPNVTAEQIRGSKFVLKGKVKRVEPQEMMCRMAIQITFGHVDPVANIKSPGDTKFWWTRHWHE